jgi:hypothetical protein
MSKYNTGMQRLGTMKLLRLFVRRQERERLFRCFTRYEDSKRNIEQVSFVLSTVRYGIFM